MRLTVVGCSGSAPGPDSAASCYLVEADDYRLLLDLGAGASGPLQRHADPAAIDAVLLSHGHGDHWSDMTHLGYLRERVGAPPLPVTGPSNMHEVLRTNPDVFTATVADATPRQLGPLTARMSHVDHAVECWASRINDALCYTADTAPCDALDELAAGARVLLAQASGFDVDAPLPGRALTAGDAGRLAARSGSKLLVLTHLRPWQDHLALLDEATKFTDCPVILAQPGLRVAL